MGIKEYTFRDIVDLWQTKTNQINEDDSELIEIVPSLEHLLGTTKSYFYVMDVARMNFAYVGDTIGNITGYSKETWLKNGIGFIMNVFSDKDKKASRLLHDDFYLYHFQQPLEDRHLYRYTNTFRIKHALGYEIWLISHLNFVKHDDTGKPLLAINFFSDITDIKKDNDILYLISKYSYETKKYEILKHKLYKPEGIEILTAREHEILVMIANGFNNQQIAEKLDITINTVRQHRKNILNKTNAENTFEIISQLKHT